MKKFNFLIALGLMATASMQAQTTVARLGFEVGDEKYTTEGALTPGGTFGDWVNVKAEDYWEEPSTDDPKSGEYCLVAKNGSTAGQTWDRGFKIGNLTIKENTPYRVSFWIKADPDFIDDNGVEKSSCLTSWLSQGIENYEKSFCTPTNANYGVQMTSGLTGDWQHISFVSYYTNADVLNNVIKDQSWVGNAVYPEAFGGDGVETYAQHFAGQLPSVFHVIINMYSPVNYSLDDIVVEEGVTFNEATFMEDVIKLDFGYPTNIAALAKANNNSFSLDPSCVSVTSNGTAVPVEFVEGKSDGFLYIFLEGTTLEPDAEVRVSFTPAADCPIVYNTDRRPSADTEGEMPVLGFSNELAYPVDNIEAIPSSWSPAKLLSTDPENDAFEIEAASLSKVTFQFDMEVSLDYASATIEKNGFTTPIPVSSLSLSEDKTAVYVSTTGLNLTDGDYTIELAGVENVMGVPCEGSQKVSFSVGEDKTGGSSESVYSTNETFAATANGTFPVGWVANDNETIHEYGLTEGGEIWNYNWGGNIGGGGCRAMTGYSGDLNGAAIYWRCFNSPNQLGTLTFGEQVKDFPAKIKQIDSLSNAAIDEALAELKDKELPTEVAANVPLKVVTPFKLDAEKSDHDKLQLVAEVESTQDTWSSDNKDGFRFSHLRVLFADDSKGLCTVKKEKYSTDVDRKDAHLAGTKGLVTVNLQLTPWNATLLDKAQKIVITTVEDDTYKAVRDSTRSAEKAFDKKILEVVTKIAKFAREEK